MMFSNGDFSAVPKFSASGKDYAADVADFLIDCARFNLPKWREDKTPVIVDLIAQARLLHNLAMCQCNGIRQEGGQVLITQADQAKIDRTAKTARFHVMESIRALFPVGTVAEFNRDPRGAPVRLVIPAEADQEIEIFIGVGDHA